MGWNVLVDTSAAEKFLGLKRGKFGPQPILNFFNKGELVMGTADYGIDGSEVRISDGQILISNSTEIYPGVPNYRRLAVARSPALSVSSCDWEPSLSYYPDQQPFCFEVTSAKDKLKFGPEGILTDWVVDSRGSERQGNQTWFFVETLSPDKYQIGLKNKTYRIPLTEENGVFTLKLVKRSNPDDIVNVALPKHILRVEENMPTELDDLFALKDLASFQEWYSLINAQATGLQFGYWFSLIYNQERTFAE